MNKEDKFIVFCIFFIFYIVYLGLVELIEDILYDVRFMEGIRWYFIEEYWDNRFFFLNNKFFIYFLILLPLIFSIIFLLISFLSKFIFLSFFEKIIFKEMVFLISVFYFFLFVLLLCQFLLYTDLYRQSFIFLNENLNDLLFILTKK